MGCIVVTTITLAMEEPLEDPESNKRKVIYTIDLVMTIIFTIEALLKIITFGFLFNGSSSYLRDSWNILDFVIVVSALLGLFGSADIGFFKVLRIMRVLRPLRMITRVRGLKIVITSLINAMPKIVQLQLVVLYFMYTFAILFTQVFSGSGFSCTMDHVSLSELQKLEVIKTKHDCINYGGEW